MRLDNIEKYFLTVVAILMVIVAIMSLNSRNITKDNRNKSQCTIVENINEKQIENKDAPCGIVNQYTFKLEKINYADVIAFYYNHRRNNCIDGCSRNYSCLY